MGFSEAEYEARIEALKREKGELEVQVNTLSKRNRNQAMLLKRLESARHEERVGFEANIRELKNALSKERIKTSMSPKFRKKSFSPNASFRSSIGEESDSEIPSTVPTWSPPRDLHNEHERVSEDDKQTWEDSNGNLPLLNALSSTNAPIIQKILVEFAIRKKERREKKRGFFGLFGFEEEPFTDLRDEAIIKTLEDNRRSLLTKEITDTLEENKGIIMEREAELLAREETHIAEKAIQKNDEHILRRPDQVNMKNICDITDSTILDVETLRRLIADRAAGMDDHSNEEEKEETNPEEDGDDSSSDGSRCDKRDHRTNYHSRKNEVQM